MYMEYFVFLGGGGGGGGGGKGVGEIMNLSIVLKLISMNVCNSLRP